MTRWHQIGRPHFLGGKQEMYRVGNFAFRAVQKHVDAAHVPITKPAACIAFVTFGKSSRRMSTSTSRVNRTPPH